MFLGIGISIQVFIKENPCRNRGCLPKLTAYEKLLKYYYFYIKYIFMNRITG